MQPDQRESLRAIAHQLLGDNEVRAIVRSVALQTQAVRLLECGYEAHIADYSPPEIVILATFVPRYQALVLLCHAMRIGDDAFRAAIQPFLPEVPEEAHRG